MVAFKVPARTEAELWMKMKLLGHISKRKSLEARNYIMEDCRRIGIEGEE